MADVKLNTRIMQKYDTLTKWEEVQDNFIPLKGEIIVFEISAPTNPDGTIGAPQRITKTGDGKTTLANLSWDSALAADVYAWAKKSAPDWNDFSTSLPVDKLPEIPSEKLPVIPPEKLEQSKDYGKVTTDAGSIEANKVHDEFTIKGEAQGAIRTLAENDIVTIKLNLDNSGNVSLSQTSTGLKGEINLSNYATKAEISTAMVFKGTLGENGTISSLPTASADTVGDTYKVISEIENAKIGDTYTCAQNDENTYEWVLIPSGDEPSGTVTNVAAGEGLTGDPITSSGIISHAVSDGASAGTSFNTAQTPAYGGSFSIPVLTTDKFGHVTGKEVVNVTLPELPELPEDKNTTYELDTSYYNYMQENVAVDVILSGSDNTKSKIRIENTPTISCYLNQESGSDEVLPNQMGFSVKDRSITATKTAAYQEITGTSAEMWIFDCGSATARLINGVKEDANLL